MPRALWSIINCRTLSGSGQSPQARSGGSCKGLPARATAVTGSNVITKIIQVDTNINESELENQVHLEAGTDRSSPLDEVSLISRSSA